MDKREAQRMLQEAKRLMGQGTALMEKAERAMESVKRKKTINGASYRYEKENGGGWFYLGRADSGWAHQRDSIKQIIDFWAGCDPEIMEHLNEKYCGNF
jgi:hypothetical protein